MRLLLPLFLLATSAAPAWAAEPEEATSVQRESRDEWQRPARGDRPQRAERPQRDERLFERVVRQQRREQEAVSASSAPPVQSEQRVRRERGAERRERWSSPEAEPVRGAIRERIMRERAEERRERSGSDAVTAGTLPPPLAGTPSVRGERRRGEQSLRNRIATEGWRREWREDRRFDWRRHRDRDWNRFRLGLYLDPFGWNYRRWNVGWNIYPGFYSSRYWIHDPWHFSLPPVYGPYRWVRYWNDALLVDLRTGRVVDVIHNVFW